MLKERDPFGEPGGDPLEGRVATGIGGGVGNAPVHDAGVARKLGTDLAEPVTQADDEVEVNAREPVEVLDRARVRSMPYSAIAAIASGCTGLGWLPALLTVTAAPARCRSSASAICDRELFPVQRNSTRTRRRECGAAGRGGGVSRNAGCSAPPTSCRSAAQRASSSR